MTDFLYADLDDVKRILRIDPTSTDDVRDARISAALTAVESVLQQSLKALGGTSGTSKFYDVAEDATLHTDPEDAQIVEVRGYRRGLEFDIPVVTLDDAYTALHTGTSYEPTADGDVILRRNPHVAPMEGALAERPLLWYDRVEVDYTSTGDIPAGVTEGVAFLTAGYYTDGPRALRGVVKEKIGDYSYETEGATAGTKAQGGQSEYVRQAMFFLQPWIRRGTSRVSVT